MDIVCFLSLNVSLSCQGKVRKKKRAGGLGGQAAPWCPPQGYSPAAPAQREHGSDGGSGWGQPRPGYRPHADVSQEMVQGCLEA